jgi:hypothetical protein
MSVAYYASEVAVIDPYTGLPPDRGIIPGAGPIRILGNTEKVDAA